jgi:hypothetical protein
MPPQKSSTNPVANSAPAKKPPTKAEKMDADLRFMEIDKSTRNKLVAWKPSHRRNATFDLIREVWFATLNERRRRSRIRQLFGHAASDVSGVKKDVGVHGEHEVHVTVSFPVP